MITITETLYKKMPDDIKACFNQLPNPSSEEVKECFPESNGGKARTGKKGGSGFGSFDDEKTKNTEGTWHGGSGNASRFFKSIIYQSKASKRDRGVGNNHPTVKSVALMEYLIKMVTREGQTVLDPFMGSGSTGVACKNLLREFIGIEMVPEYAEIARRRIDAVSDRLL